MKKIMLLSALVGAVVISCIKEEVIVEGAVVEQENIQLRSSSTTQIAYVGSDSVVYLLNDESEIPDLEAFIVQQEQDIADGLISRPKYKYQSEKCVLSNGARGLECKPQKKGDCTSEFGCIVSHDGGDY